LDPVLPPPLLSSHRALAALLAASAALIAASPGATRTLRPLCRMLGTELPTVLRLPPRPRPARPRPARPRPARPKPAKPPRAKGPSPGLAPGDQPFRPYVLKAIRYARRHGLWRP
jgi:hypothetical protein